MSTTPYQPFEDAQASSRQLYHRSQCDDCAVGYRRALENSRVPLIVGHAQEDRRQAQESRRLFDLLYPLSANVGGVVRHRRYDQVDR